LHAASRVQHVSDLHPKFALRPHIVCKYGRHDTNIYLLSLLCVCYGRPYGI